MEIIIPKTEKDFEICDYFIRKLMEYESGLDSSINPNTDIIGFHKKQLANQNYFAAYVMADKPVGYIFGCIKNFKGNGTTTNRVFVDSLFIEEHYRNQGIGQLLLAELEKWAIKNFGDDYEIELLCLSNNQNALKFYKKLGYIQVKQILRKPKKD